MHRRTFGIAFASALAFVATGAVGHAAELKIGDTSPDFTIVNSDNKPVKLSDFRGKTVVLEWTNDGCPYVRKHYGTGNMQALQKKWTDQGVVWLSVISSPPGEQGYAEGPRANQLTAERKASPTAVLLDPKQQVARAYGAMATPTMYVINGDGKFAYMGAIDDKPTSRPADVEGAKNYVDQALAEIKAGKAVSTTTTRAYGCVVKYTS
ncbi:MAG: thioredoxin family protein [Pseudorhodoplanes sp.]